jgi:hypothetical protein
MSHTEEGGKPNEELFALTLFYYGCKASRSSLTTKSKIASGCGPSKGGSRSKLRLLLSIRQ